MSSIRMHILMTLFLMASTSSEKVHVSVMNRLGDGRSINIHCQSKDNDLGPKTVADGDQYGWDFSVNVSGTTLFYCDMGWEKVRSFVFDAFDYQRDRARCSSNCSWIMAEEGVYGLNDGTGFWEFMYSWTS